MDAGQLELATWAMFNYFRLSVLPWKNKSVLKKQLLKAGVRLRRC